MRSDPLVLFGSPRGGTSLAAGCFVNHGFWTGKMFGGPNGVGSGGYVNYENDAIKAFIKKNWKLHAGDLMEKPEAENLFAFCSKTVPAGKLWMFKGPVEYYPIFKFWFPNMTPAFVFRNEHQSVEAVVRRRGPQEREHARKIIQSRYQHAKEILATQDYSFALDADAIVRGDYSTVEYVLEAYGIELNQEKCGAHIDPSKWHV